MITAKEIQSIRNDSQPDTGKVHYEALSKMMVLKLCDEIEQLQNELNNYKDARLNLLHYKDGYERLENGLIELLQDYGHLIYTGAKERIETLIGKKYQEICEGETVND